MLVKENYLEEPILWSSEDSTVYPYSATKGGVRLLLRINDFPDKHLYTLMVDDKELESFDDWPDVWIRPEPYEHAPDGGSVSIPSERKAFAMYPSYELHTAVACEKATEDSSVSLIEVSKSGYRQRRLYSSAIGILLAVLLMLLSVFIALFFFINTNERNPPSNPAKQNDQ
jgi:hypothetical protein